ncbi:transmembrane protein 243 isoform X1 [Rhinolophus sinicus]|uniref:transmembrane protein 243 isoform X1 n=1 Tax=Rhinolophus sinicus TaxID=89399 RepID=UPI003D79A697
MEDFSTRIYGTSVLDNRPLFGETSAKDRIINLVVGSLTSLLILVTLISAFVFPQLPPKPLNIFFAVCISLSSITACILSYDLREDYIPLWEPLEQSYQRCSPPVPSLKPGVTNNLLVSTRRLRTEI